MARPVDLTHEDSADLKPGRFAAFMDAKALIPALQRTVILSLAEAGLFRAATRLP